MFGLPLAFSTPWVLIGLLTLPVIWWLLRLTPPKPQEEVFPPLKILARLLKQEDTPAKSPWWLTLLRLTLAGLVVLAMAGPILNPQENQFVSDGPLAIVLDDGWASAPDWDKRKEAALELVNQARDDEQPVMLFSTTL